MLACLRKHQGPKRSAIVGLELYSGSGLLRAAAGVAAGVLSHSSEGLYGSSSMTDEAERDSAGSGTSNLRPSCNGLRVEVGSVALLEECHGIFKEAGSFWGGGEIQNLGSYRS